MKARRPLLALTFVLATANVQAQAPAAAATNATAATDDDRDGTTVMGDRESPIGLLIAPWREAAPEKDLDRPVRFLQEELMPIDAEVFRRQTEYYYTIAAHLKSRGVAGYAEAIQQAGAEASPATNDTIVGVPPSAPPANQ